VAAEVQRRLLVGDFGHLTEAQSALVDDQVGEGVDGLECAQGANGVAQPAGLGAAKHEIGGDALEKLRQSTDVYRVLLDLVEDQIHEELARLYPVRSTPSAAMRPCTTGMSLVLKEKMSIGPMSGGRVGST